MQHTYTYEAMKTIYNAEVAAFEATRQDGRNRVLIHYDNGSQMILKENMAGFYSLIAESTGISVPHRITLANHFIVANDPDRTAAVRLPPVCMEPGQTFMGFKRPQGPFYINRFKINKRPC